MKEGKKIHEKGRKECTFFCDTWMQIHEGVVIVCVRGKREKKFQYRRSPCAMCLFTICIWYFLYITFFGARAFEKKEKKGGRKNSTQRNNNKKSSFSSCFFLLTIFFSSLLMIFFFWHIKGGMSKADNLWPLFGDECI